MASERATNQVELSRRYLARAAEPLRMEQRADGQQQLVGYAAVFYRPGVPETEFRLWGNCVERIAAGAFARAIREDDVRALWNHEAGSILGRIRAGTLRLVEDAVGLRYEIDPPDSELGRQVVESVRRGDVSGSSFAFNPREVLWSKEPRSDGGELEVCTLRDVELWDVGPVTFPAYAGTSADLRGRGEFAAVERSYRDWQAADAERAAEAAAAAVAARRRRLRSWEHWALG